jgi:hypothetical protein
LLGKNKSRPKLSFALGSKWPLCNLFGLSKAFELNYVFCICNLRKLHSLLGFTVTSSLLFPICIRFDFLITTKFCICLWLLLLLFTVKSNSSTKSIVTAAYWERLQGEETY